MSDYRTYHKHCPHCHKDFMGTKLQVYCSPAHKQAAYRERHNPPMIRAINKATAYRRMVATKAGTLITLKCVGCGCQFTVTALQGEQTLYHNRACRQRAYRERKAQRDAIRRD